MSCPRCEQGSPCGRDCDPDDDATPVMSQDLVDVAEWLSRQGRGFVAQMITDGSWRADLYRMRGGKA